MTDRFEEAVRRAGRSLGETTAAAPSYHDAYRRGTRRRVMKRSALAAAGALVVVAAATLGPLRVPGNEPIGSDDVAVEVAAATSTAVAPRATAVATTPPLDVPASPAPSASASVPSVSADDDSEGTVASQAMTDRDEAGPAPAETPGSVTASPPAAGATSAPESTGSAAEPSPTDVAATSAAPAPNGTEQSTNDPVPVPSAAPGPATLPSPTPNEAADTGATSNPGADSGGEAVGDNGGSTAATMVGPDDGGTMTDEVTTATVPPQPDAVLVAGVVGPNGQPCDIDQDGGADAACRLLPEYPCGGNGDVRAGYDAFDDDANGSIDTCRAVGLTSCDSTGDGFADTPCIIELGSSESVPPDAP